MTTNGRLADVAGKYHKKGRKAYKVHCLHGNGKTQMV
nr:hypothetical protein [Acinetobacter wuhouensis]